MSAPYVALHFERDAAGTITGVSEAAAGSESYRYDPLYRLAGVDDPSGQAIEAYTYNNTGDRLSKTGNGLATGIYGYQPGTHWLSSIGTASRSYDANGNTTDNAFAGDAWGYGYNGRNRMTVVQRNGVTVGTYVYNSLEQRIAKTADGATTRFAYGGDSQLLTEQSLDKAREYLWLSSMVVGILDTGPARLWLTFKSTRLGRRVWPCPMQGHCSAAGPTRAIRLVKPNPLRVQATCLTCAFQASILMLRADLATTSIEITTQKLLATSRVIPLAWMEG